jgi:ATP-dependent Clp protease ATP-binding subunit ClpC
MLPRRGLPCHPGLVFERFTDRARRVVVYAQEEARMLDHDYIGTEHILLGLIHEGEGVAARALVAMSISLDAARQRVEEIIGRGSKAPAGHIPFTPRAKKVLELALREALQMGHDYIGTEHLLLGLIREEEGVAAQVLVALGASLERVREAVIAMLEGYAGGPAMTPVAQGPLIETPSKAPPECPNCFAPLEETLAIRAVEAAGGDEPGTVKIAFCRRCGVALGTVA